MKARKVISDAALKKRLRLLRAALRGCGAANVSLMNATAASALFPPGLRGLRLRRALKAVEPYIPLRITDAGFKGLLAAANEGVEKARRYERRLADSSTAHFLQSALTGDRENWREMVEVCRLIRTYKEAVGG